MISFKDVSFGFPQKELYNKINFEINEDDHAVLIGSNGTGKSTLINLILHTDDYTYDGIIKKENVARIGYISQFVNHETDEVSVYDFLAKPFEELQKKADEICAEMESAKDLDEVYARYQVVLDEQDSIDAYNYDSNIKKILATAGLTDITEVSVNKISGGEYKLLSIIKQMLLKPQLLIMDEPDVFLDFENVISLMKLINGYKGTILTITHNRLLLSQCFDKILHIENEELFEFPGNFAEYNYSLLENKITVKEHTEKFDDIIKAQEQVVVKLRTAATNLADPVKGRQLRARVSYLERLREKRGNDPFLSDFGYEFHFPQLELSDENTNYDEEINHTEDNLMVTQQDSVISVKDYNLSYEKTILSNVSFEVKRGEKIAIVGANGTGKSSLLRDIYDEYANKGDLNIGFFKQIYDDGDLTKLSGGERNIKQVEALENSTAEVLFLDEPTSHLDTYAQIALEKAIREYRGTVLMVSHDFFTIMNCADRILILENGTMRETSGRTYRKSIYKKYFASDIFEQERIRIEKEIKINDLLRVGKCKEAREVLG